VNAIVVTINGDVIEEKEKKKLSKKLKQIENLEALDRELNENEKSKLS